MKAKVKFEGGPADGQIIEVDGNPSEYRIVETSVEHVYVRKVNDCSSFWYAGSHNPHVHGDGPKTG